LQSMDHVGLNYFLKLFRYNADTYSSVGEGGCGRAWGGGAWVYDEMRRRQGSARPLYSIP